MYTVSNPRTNFLEFQLTIFNIYIYRYENVDYEYIILHCFMNSRLVKFYTLVT